MRRRRKATTTKTKTKLQPRNPRHTATLPASHLLHSSSNIRSLSSTDSNDMKSFGLFASSSSVTSSSSSSSSSSNLSPLALPFTVERSNPNKFNLGTISDSHFSFTGKSDGSGFWSTSPNFQAGTNTQGLSADSIPTATVPSTYSSFPNPNPNPNPKSISISAPSAHNWSSNQHVVDASFSTAFTASSGDNRSSVPAVNASAIGPSHGVTDASFSRALDTPNTYNWVSMNSSVVSGLEPVDLPSGYVFGVSADTQPHKWSLGNDSRSFLQDFGSSQVSYSQSSSGSKYSGQVDRSQGKEDSSLFGPAFGRPVTSENDIGSLITGASNGIGSPATSHGLVSSGFLNEHTIAWNDIKPYYFVESRSDLYDSLSDHISPITTKSQDFSSTSPLLKNDRSLSRNSLKEKEAYDQAVGFEYELGLKSQLPDMNSTEEVNSAEHVSEHLDHHNPGEDSPCWKGAPTHFSSSGSLEQESSQQLMKKLQSNSASGEDLLLPMDRSLHETVENAADVASESLDVNTIVKALNNLSELLVRQYSRDECRLKEHDHKALDHVIANLNVCMSSKVQQVDPAQKCSPPRQFTSNERRETVHLSALHQERNNDQCGKKNEEPHSAYVRNESLPKDYNMVQKIKMVLDEDLVFKEDLPSDPLLYKNLWLEAEAELCVSSYKARLHRAKREMGKSKALDLFEAAPDIKKVSISHISPTAPKVLHEAAGSKTLKTHAPNVSLPIVDNGDVDNSVMARFNILKLREQSIPVSMAEKEPADVEAVGDKSQSPGVAEEPHLKHLLDTDDTVVMRAHGNQKKQGPLATEDVDHAVMARLNILKSRGEPGYVNAQVSEAGVGTSMMQSQFGSMTVYTASSSGWEYVDGWMNEQG